MIILNMKIGIYGGAFNPIHKGHIKIAKHVIDFLGLEKLIFVPSYKGPFKKNIELASGQDRMNMIELVLENKMEVSAFEINRKGVSYTIDTIKYFKNKYHNYQSKKHVLTGLFEDKDCIVEGRKRNAASNIRLKHNSSLLYHQNSTHTGLFAWVC